MKISQLNELLNQRVTELCQSLFPGGKQMGNEWCVGSLRGEPGTSLKINLRKCLWTDFADASGGKAGDLVQLFIALNNGDKTAGINAAHAWLGIPRWKNTQEVTKKTAWVTPKEDWGSLDGEIEEYLVETRGIPKSILDAYEVKATENEYVFLTRTHKGKLCLATYVSVNREGSKKKVRHSKDGAAFLWGHQAEVQSELPAHELIITEGQIDAMSYAAQGLRAVSVPGGCKNMGWIENSWSWLEQFTTIYLSMDMDEEGQAAAVAISSRLGMERCKMIPLCHKDANECHLNGCSLLTAIKKAKDIKPAKLVSALELIDDVWLRLGLGRREEQGIPFMGWVGEKAINFRLRPKELTVWSGHEGSGKSNLMYQLIAYLIGEHDIRIAIATLEDDPDVIPGLILTHMLAMQLNHETISYEDYSSLYQQLMKNLWIYNHRGIASHEDVLLFAEYSARRYGCSHIFIDSLARLDINIEDNEKANAFMEKIISTLDETGAHVHLVCHSKKTGDEYDMKDIPKSQDIKGSKAIAILAHNILVVWKNGRKRDMLSNEKTKADEEKIRQWREEMPDTIISIRKQRVGGQTGQYNCYYNPENYRVRRQYFEKDYPYIEIHLDSQSTEA